MTILLGIIMTLVNFAWTLLLPFAVALSRTNHAAAVGRLLLLVWIFGIMLWMSINGVGLDVKVDADGFTIAAVGLVISSLFAYQSWRELPGKLVHKNLRFYMFDAAVQLSVAALCAAVFLEIAVPQLSLTSEMLIGVAAVIAWDAYIHLGKLKAAGRQ